MISGIIALYAFVIIARAIVSWFPVNPSGPFVTVNRVLFQITEPVLAPARRIIPNIGLIDISPFAVLILLNIVGSLLRKVGL